MKFGWPVIGIVALLIATGSVWNGHSGTLPGVTDEGLFTVVRQDLSMVITERGSIDAQLETDIRCEVTSTSHQYRGPSSTPIIYLVPDGQEVEKDELLAELDSAIVRDHLHDHLLRYYSGKSRKIRYEAIYENRKIQNEISLDNAKLRLDLARLRLEQYCDREVGTHKLNHDAIARDVLEQRSALELASVLEQGKEALFNLGYSGKSQLDNARFKRLVAENRLSADLSRQRQQEQFDHKKLMLNLQGALESAERALKQVIADNEAATIQAEASRDEAVASFEREAERVTQLEAEIERCKIYAPHAGTVAYERNDRTGSAEVNVGSRVYRMQKILSLPNLSRMQVKTSVHEAALNRVRKGTPVTVHIAAYPDEVFQGVVNEVSPIPTSERISHYFATGVRTFRTIIHINGEVTDLRPGMTATVDINVPPVEDALVVPVESVIQEDLDFWCFVKTDGDVEKRSVVLGDSNDRFVHITQGLSEGERIVQDPSDILKAMQRTNRNISPTDGIRELPKTLRHQDEKLVTTPGSQSDPDGSNES